MCYVDDVVMASETPEQHVTDVCATLEVIREASLTCHPDKCQFGMSSIKHLGFQVTGSGMTIQQAKVEVVHRVATPKDRSTLRAVLGFLNYYRKFVPDYSKQAVALNELLKAATPWQWGERQEKELQDLMGVVKHAPVLQLPDMAEPFKLYTDWSKHGMGAVLCQNKDGEEQGSHTPAGAATRLRATIVHMRVRGSRQLGE